MEKEKIDEILRSHKEWIDTNGKKGKRADFSNKDLINVDLHGADLSNANFMGTDLSNANFMGTDLSNANFYKAILCHANLSEAKLVGAILNSAILLRVDFRGADLYGADLSHADISDANLCCSNLSNSDFRVAIFSRSKIQNAALRGARLPNGIFMVEGAGSSHRCTYYDAINDFVKCGCWDDDNGNNLDSFKKRIEDVYGPHGKTPNQKHFKAYQAAINYFEVCRDEYIDHMMHVH